MGNLITAAIVAHPDRSAGAQRLCMRLNRTGEGIPAAIFMDNEELGCDDNHVRAWDWLVCQDSEWLMVLEDDALPIPEFTEELTLALQHAPCGVVSLYLGRTRPAYFQHRVAHALTGCSHPGPDDQVDTSTPWVVTDRLLHCVAVVMRYGIALDMMPYLPQFVAEKQAIDQGISAYLKSCSIPVAYTVPSLVDHADGGTLARHAPGFDNPVHGPRVAWAVGDRARWSADFRIM